jgi:hypothetical protein
MTDKEVEVKLREYFEENYELLRLEGGHALTEEGKQNAFNQILYYWKKLNPIAKKVTPKGRKFSIEGIVDIVREDEETWMYDIKSHDPEYVKTHIDLYEKQLNVYSYIWQNLRKNDLDHTAIIATTLPLPLRTAVQAGDEKQISVEMNKWEPIIDIPYKEEHIKETIKDFACIVDKIEDSEFSPPTLKELQKPLEGTNIRFATRVCRNCDSRFSCSAFREYVLTMGAKSYSQFKKYFDDLGDDIDTEEWKGANLNLDLIENIVRDLAED